MHLATSAGTCGSCAAGRCPGGTAGAPRSLAPVHRHLLVLLGRRWRQGRRIPHSSAWLPRLLPQHKHVWEYFRAVRARKTNPGNPDKEHAKANFHVTSRNHMFTQPPAGLQRGGEVPRCWVSKTRLARSCSGGGQSSRTSLHPPKPGATLEAAWASWGQQCL